MTLVIKISQLFQLNSLNERQSKNHKEPLLRVKAVMTDYQVTNVHHFLKSNYSQRHNSYRSSSMENGQNTQFVTRNKRP